MKVALVYDRVNKWGGAERVLLALHEMFPEAPLFTSVYDPERASWAKIFPEIKTSLLQKIPMARKNHELLGALMPLAFESFDFTGYDLVLSVTSESAKGIIVKPGTMHICYLLTPTRYLWSHNKEYFSNPMLKLISRPVIKYLKKWDQKASKHPDRIVAISGEVARRVKKYYGRSSTIIFPPVNVQVSQGAKKQNYFLIVSRLVKYKKIDLAIAVFNKNGLKLVIVGSGREEKRLKKLAKNNIVFAGHVSESKLSKYYKSAKALIMPQEEDFGIVSVEAQSHGIPVIAFKKGGASDTIKNGLTGILFDKQSEDSLEEAINKFKKLENNFEKNILINNSLRFSKQNFQKKMMDLIKKMVN